MNESEFVIIGANGQVSRSLRAQYPNAKVVGSATLDITDRDAVQAFDWSGVGVILNGAGSIDVDGAETPEGRVAVWQINAIGVRNLAEVALAHDLTLVHVSSDYVFDGTQQNHTEDEPLSPLGVYGQAKAAGDIAASLVPKHYLLRTSWVIGDGKNFVRSIMGLAGRDISPNVVADQFGRLTFTDELARGIKHLLHIRAPYGTYNLSNGGDVVSWADVARQIYSDLGRNDLQVGDTTAAEYFAGKISSPRPIYSGFDLSKIEATGFTPRDWRDDLQDYVTKELT